MGLHYAQTLLLHPEALYNTEECALPEACRKYEMIINDVVAIRLVVYTIVVKLLPLWP
jgi:hypothetical protein